MPRSGLAVNQGKSIRLGLAPAQAAYLSRPAPRQQEQAHRRDADRILGFEQAQDRAELRQIIRLCEKARRSAAISCPSGPFSLNVRAEVIPTPAALHIVHIPFSAAGNLQIYQPFV